MNIPRAIIFIVCAGLLAACTPHPGSGQWISIAEKKPGYMDEFARLNVMYEGRVDIFAQQGKEAKRRCFWRGISKDVIEMTCVEASNTEVEEQYRLHVMGVEGRAELRRGDRVVGRYERASQESGAK